MSDNERKHDYTIEIDATPEQVWEAIATAAGVASWFAPIVRVEPGEGGSMYIEWGPGMGYTQRIDVWEPNSHLRVSGDRGEGAPPIVVDYYVETKGGHTVLRLVHSGFGPEASFDGEYEATGAAWPVFLKMLKHSAEQGVGRCRNITVFRVLEVPRDESWARILAADPFEGGKVWHNSKSIACVNYPARRNDLLSIFCEKCGGSTMLTIANLLYGATDAEADAVRTQWSNFVDGLFGKAE